MIYFACTGDRNDINHKLTSPHQTYSRIQFPCRTPALAPCWVNVPQTLANYLHLILEIKVHKCTQKGTEIYFSCIVDRVGSYTG